VVTAWRLCQKTRIDYDFPGKDKNRYINIYIYIYTLHVDTIYIMEYIILYNLLNINHHEPTIFCDSIDILLNENRNV